jgi:diamine N-acetyltransferase
VSAAALRLRPTTGDDLAFVLELEAGPDAAPFIVRWSRQRHEEALTAADEEHQLVVEEGDPVGFLVLAGLTRRHRSVELRRIVIDPKGRGVGRRAILVALDHAFRNLGAHRVWLDVKTHSERARRAYAACGFVVEGTLRDALLTDGAYESLVVMSVLSEEWRAREQPGAGADVAMVSKRGASRRAVPSGG